MKVQQIGKTGIYSFYCPGCKQNHCFYTKFANGINAKWNFNGDVNNPTFSPSLVNRIGDESICHLFVRDGKIIYLNDCKHELAGKTVEMEEIE